MCNPNKPLKIRSTFQKYNLHLSENFHSGEWLIENQKSNFKKFQIYLFANYKKTPT